MAFVENRSAEEIQQNKQSVERDKFDLEQWRLRAPLEVTLTKLQVIADEQQIYRRHIEVLASARKIYNGIEKKDENLMTAIDTQMLKFVNALRLASELTSEAAVLTTDLT